MTQFNHEDGRPVPLTELLADETDEALRAVIARARQILTARDDERKREAAAAIRRIAREHGLNVAVKKPARKRGRPAKNAASS